MSDKMSSYHKPKVFRSNDGCCICKAKSSSSRFTDSGKYENAFSLCFKLEGETRFGEICNACVLIVKRWRNLPRNTEKNWGHVVDSRVGPGGSKVTFRNVKRKPDPQTLVATEEKFEKIRKKKQKLVRKKTQEKSQNNIEGGNDVPGFINLSYFTRRNICCGVIYEGLAGEIIIDQRFFKRCQLHSPSSSTQSSSEASNESGPHLEKAAEDVANKKMFEESDDNVDDTDSLSFYSDESECGLSKVSKGDLPVIHDTDGDEGFFDRSELMKRHLLA